MASKTKIKTVTEVNKRFLKIILFTFLNVE